MKKFAVLSHVLPPSPSGQSVMLYRILSRIDPSDYYLIASRTHQHQNDSDTLHLQSRTYDLPPEPVIRFGIEYVRSIVSLFIRLVTRTRNLRAILSREPTRAFIACSGDPVDMPAAFLASRSAHIPFYAYIFDDYVYQWVGKYRSFAKLVAPLIFKRAAGIIVPNEFICEEYRRRYGVTPALVRNPCDADELGKEPYAPWPSEKGKIKIAYTGAIYHANYGCFHNLLDALKLLPQYPLELHIFTAQTHEQLLEQGITSEEFIFHHHLPYSKILEQQREADILFLPLAFDTPIPEVIRTSAPGKLGEYLASGRPVLAHVPTDSFVADYCARHQCASIANQNDPLMLAHEIEHIITDGNFRTRILINALSRSQADFHPQDASEKLIALLAG